MRQLLQSVRGGALRIADGPDPIIGPTEVLVQTAFSVVSPGTERSLRRLASSSLLDKARARPDLVRQVVTRARQNGVRSTFQAVQARLDEEMPLGYSGAGTVLEVGEAVSGLRPGMRVATGGAGHADVQVVAGLLAVPVPDDVTDAQAALATVASIALHGLRMADVGPGGAVCVVGLGLVGQLTMRLARATGLRAFGVDVRTWTVDRVSGTGVGAAVEEGAATTDRVLDWSRGRGADAVLITAATPSSEPIRLAPDRLRDRGTIVVVGDIGLDLERRTLYEKEATVRVARSYGPGRYERSYERWGVDIPPGYVRFTEGRNLEVVLDLMESGTLAVDDLITHEFDFGASAQAYDLLADPTAHYLAIELKYAAARAATVWRRAPQRQNASRTSIALVGAGQFARGVLVPAIVASGLGDITSVSSASGTSASRLASTLHASARPLDDAIDDPLVSIVVIATSHDSHADLAVRVLKAGKHVFCEKPLALSDGELADVVAAWESSDSHLAVGFNRRHSVDVSTARDVFSRRSGPLCLNYRVNAGTLPDAHWYSDRTMGGRLIGEVCHFIDTCNAIVGGPPRLVGAIGSLRGELALVDDVGVSLAYADGSIATITYASAGNTRTPKERLEILGGGHTVVLDDFRTITIDGKAVRHQQDKGHTAQLRAFARQMDRPEGRQNTIDALDTMSVTLAAVRSLQSGAFVVPAGEGDRFGASE